MLTRTKVLNILMEEDIGYHSGQELGNRLGVSRNAIWKSIEQLREDGYEIESRTRVGYKLVGGTHSLTESSIISELNYPTNLCVFDSIDSTNTYASNHSEKITVDKPLLVVSNKQTDGRGRMGRKFFSPPGTGIYMTIGIRPKFAIDKALYVTIATAVAVSRAVEEIADVLRNVKKDYVTEQSQQMQKVKKSTYSLWRIVAIITLIGTLIGGGYAAYLSLKTVPEQRQLLAANEAFIQKDYRTCIDSLREVEPADMEKGTLYILAYSYANMESFRQDEMRNIIDNLSTSSNPKILVYWIRIGRLETKKAEEIALSLSDDKLLIYAYMKEADDLENNTKIDGSKKKQRLDELENQIEKLGDKYQPKEEETVEKIDGAVQENTSTQEPQTQEPTDTAQ